MNLAIRICPLAVVTLSLVACGGETPPPKAPDAPASEAPQSKAPSAPVVEQELGSIDQRAVEKKFNDLQGKLETCHSQGRGRVEYLAGDVKVFLRVGKDGRVKYSYFEDSTLGDHETEKCILDLFSATEWPKPVGGEAEIRNGFGWPGGSERAPASWGPEKVTGALEADKEAAKSIEKCKSGISGKFRVTAYVEPADDGDEEQASAHPPKGGKGPKKDAKGHHGAKGAEHGGKFKSIGVAAPNKDAASKIECVVEGLTGLSLPSPGSYAAKVTFSL